MVLLIKLNHHSIINAVIATNSINQYSSLYGAPTRSNFSDLGLFCFQRNENSSQITAGTSTKQGL